MRKEALGIIGALGAPLLALSSTCSEDSVDITQVGSIVDKKHQSEQTWLLAGTITVIDDEDHILRLEDCGEGQTQQCRTVDLFVPKEIFDRTRVGDFVNFKYKKDVSQQDPHTIQYRR